MPLFARPDLSDIQFKQLPDSVLTLQGTTKFVNKIEIPNGIGGSVPISADGAVTGNVLTYDVDGKIKLLPPNAASIALFDSNKIITRAGESSVNIGGTTVQQFLEGYFFPKVPQVSAISISTPVNSLVRQFGDASVGNLAWSVTKDINGNNIKNINASTDGSGVYNNIIQTNLSIDHSLSGVIPYTIIDGTKVLPATPIITTTAVYKLKSESVLGEVSEASTLITWKNKSFYFTNGIHYIDASIITVFPTGQLISTKALTTTQTFNNQYFYYSYPMFMGTSIFIINGMLVNSWGNSVNNTLYSFNYTNSNGYTIPYYVARSDNKLTGTYTISIT